MNCLSKILVPLLFLGCLTGVAAAEDSSGYPDVEWSLLQVSLIPGQLAVVSADTPVYGVNFEPFWGVQQTVYGVNFQPLCGFSGTVNGISVQGFGETEQFAGLQLGIVTLATRFQGVNFSLVSGAWENRGLQIGVANFSGNNALVTYQSDGVPPSGGIQLGLVNSASGGIQFGLLNYNAGSPFPWMILFNFSSR